MIVCMYRNLSGPAREVFRGIRDDEDIPEFVIDETDEGETSSFSVGGTCQDMMVFEMNMLLSGVLDGVDAEVTQHNH